VASVAAATVSALKVLLMFLISAFRFRVLNVAPLSAVFHRDPPFPNPYG
jgi:hypothetical protein